MIQLIPVHPDFPLPSALHAPAKLDDGERKLLEDAIHLVTSGMPKELRENRAIKTVIASNIIDAAAEHYRKKIKYLVELSDKNEISFKKNKAAADALNIQLQEAQAELRAARENRGIYESKKLAELSADLANKERALVEASEQLTQLNTDHARLQKEQAAHAVMVAAHEREQRDLMGAAVLTATAMQTAAKHLTEAKQNLEDRYAKLPPFLSAVHGDIVAALAQLPKAK